MYQASANYKRNIGAPSRRSKAFIRLKLADISLPSDTVLTSSTHPDSTLSTMSKGHLAPTDFHSIGVGLPSEIHNPHVGWISSTLSNGKGNFSQPEHITMTYASAVASRNFYVVFPAFEPAVAFDVEIIGANGNQLYKEEVVDNQSVIWGVALSSNILAKSIKVTVHSTKFPVANAKIISMGVVSTLVVGDGSFSDFTLLEEVTSDDAAPFGGVSSNELSFGLFNPSFSFSPTNLSGPFGGLLVPGISVDLHAGIMVSNDVYEMMPLGTFEVAEWSAPSGTLEASVTAYDALYAIQSEEVPMLRVQQSTNVGRLLFDLLRALGVPAEKIKIDPAISEVIPFGYVPTGSVSDALNTLSAAGMCHIHVDRNNNYVAKRRAPSTKSYVSTWTDTDQLMSINVPERFDTLYNKLNVKINMPSLHRNEALLESSDMPAHPGMTSYPNLTFAQSPVVQLEGLLCAEGTMTRLDNINYGSHTVTFSLNNRSNYTESVKVIASGVYCEFLTQEVSYTTGSAGRQTMSIDNELIQTKEHADVIAARVSPFLSDPFNRFEITARGDFALELSDVIAVKALTQNVPLTYIEVTRSEIKYDGGFECDLTGRKVYVNV